MAYVKLPNGSYLEVPKGMQPIQALQEARSAFPRAFMSEEELSSKQGFVPAAGQAFGEFKTKSLVGLGELTGNATLQQMAQDASEADEKAKKEGKNEYLPTEEEDIELARKKGLLPLAGAYARKYISEPLGGIAGRYGAPMAAGAGAAGLAALAAPASGVTAAGALGAGLLAKGVTSLVDAPAEIGENIQQQIDVDAPINSTKAIAYGLGQAALAGFGIPGMGKLAAPVQKLLGKETAVLAKEIVAGTTTKEQALAQLSGTLKNVIAGTGSAAVTGAGLMVGTQAMRRASADQDITSPEALEEYKQNLIGAAELAPLFGIPHGAFTRRGQVKQVESAVRERQKVEEREKRAREDVEAATQADALDAEKYNRAVQDTFGAPERPAEGVQGRTADMFGGTYAAPEGALPPQRALGDNLLLRERERAVQEQFVESKSPQEVMSQERNLKQYVTGLRDQVSAAAAKADIKTLGELTPKLKEVEAAYAAAYKEYAALDIPEFKFQQLTDQIETKTKQLQKAGGAQGDFAKIEKLTADIQKLQAELEKVKPPSGPDLFAVEKEAVAVEKEAVAKSKAEAAAALAQGQQDFLAQVGKPETRIDARQRQTLERYNDNVRQLDEAYAANADKRLIDKLVDSVQADAAERAAIVAKTSDTRTLAQEEAGQQRIARITRAIAEAEAKGDTASVAGLRNQLAKAIVETARPDVSTRRNRALEDQQAAIEELRSQVEDLKTKRYLGEGARDMSTAASLKAGLERKANETIGQYVEAAIRDVNAVREQNNVKKLTQTEAIRLAMDVRGHLENAVRNLNVTALRMPKESTVSTLEKQLAQIKRKHHKGESTSPKRAEEFALRPEFDTLRTQQKRGEKVEGGTPFETETRKAEREELEAKAEKEKTKERAYADVGNPDQRNLFGEKDLEPIATTRASAENFMKLLRSGTVSNMRAKIASIEKAKQEAQKIEETAKRGYSIQHNYEATYERLKYLEDTAKALEKSLDDLLMAPGQARNAIVAEKARLESVKARAAEQVKASEEKLKALEERKAKATPAAELAEEFTPRKETELRRIDEQIKEEKRKAKAALEALKEEAHPVFKIDELQDALKKADENHPKQLEVFAKIKDALRTRIKDLLETKVAAEKSLMKDAWEHTKQKVAAAKTALEKNAVQAKAEKERRLAEGRIAQSEQALRENAEIEKQKTQQAKLEADAQASEMSVRKEVVTTKYKVTDPKQLKQLKQYKSKLADELAKEEPAPAVLKDLQKKISQIAPDEPVLRTKITNPIPFNKSETLKDYASPRVANETRAERAEKKRAQQAQEREDVIARGESQFQEKENRVSLQDARNRESELNKQLKGVQKELAKVTKEKESLEKAITNAKTEKGKTHWQAKLDAFVKENSIEDLLKREQVLKSGLDQVKDVGAKAERALVVLGNKAGRETTTKVKGVEQTAEQKELAKIKKAYDRAIAKSFEAYLEAEAPARRENIGPRAEYRGPSGTDYYDGLSGNRYRAVLQKESRLDPVLSKRVTDIIEQNVPKDVNVRSVESFAELPKDVKEVLARDGFEEGSKQAETVQGFTTKKGDVYVIRGRHATLKELETTYVHEIIGHAGVERILGKEGMEKLAERIRTQDGGAQKLASKLGADVRKNFDSSMADYALAIEEMKRRGDPQVKIDAVIKEMDVKATQELIAYTAELRVDENLRTQAGRWMKEIVGMVRQWLRDHGFAELSKVSTNDIYNIIRQSQRNFNRGELGAFREVNGQVSFRTQKAKFNDSFDSELSKSIQQTVPSQKPWLDRIFGNAMGMTMMHRFEDNFAGLAHMATVNKRLTGSIEGTQMMYFNRLSHNISNMVGEWVTHGPVGIAMTRGKKGEPTAEYQYVSKTEKYKLELAEERASKTPDKTKIADLEQKIKTGVNGLAPAYEAIGKAAPEIGNTEAAFQAFTYYMAGERVTGLAQREGISFKEALKKLDLGEKLSEADVQRGLQFGRNNKHFQEARKFNKIYNDAQIDFLVETGYLTPAKAAELKKGDFVPFYRERNGEIVDNEYNIRVGDLTTQKHLKELIGGDQPILPFHISSLQNTRMLAEMGMKNIATKNTAYTLNNWGVAEVRPGDGPAAANVIRFYDKGEKKHAILNFKDAYVGMEKKLEEMKKDGKANTPEYKKLREKAEASRENSELFGNIPAELVVRGMEGIALTLPAAVSWLRGPADLLRKGVTRNPLYAVRSLYKESLSSWITTGADVTPLLSSLKAAKQVLGKETPTTLKELRAAGITGGHVYSGTMSDLNTIALQIASGKSGWEKTWAGLDRLAIRADEAGRVALYDGFVRKGMSQMEAQLATLESQNFTKRGYSPTMSMLSVMIPFFNSQVSGLSTFVRNMSGNSLFEDKLNLQRTAMMRGAVMAGSTLLYTSLMQNNKAYKNATDEQKLNNWFVPIPFFEEPLRVAIPFEAGTVFKAVPEALYNLMATDAKAKFVLPALRDQILQSVPGYSSKFVPQGIKPILEAYTNKDFFSGQDIESKRQLDELPGYRENANTTEAAKTFGKLVGISPIQLDHALNSYTGGAGIAILSMLNPVLRSSTPPDLKPSQYAVFGRLFQPVDGAGIINKAFKEAEEIEQINKTYKNLEEKNPSEAIAFANKNIRAVDFGSEAGRFKRQMGEYAKEEREIRALSRTAMSSAEKTRLIDKIKQEKIDYAKEFRASVNG